MGNCKICVNTVQNRSLVNRRKKNKNAPEKLFEEIIDINKQIKEPRSRQPRAFHNNILSGSARQIEVLNIIPLQTLTKGDWFGGRVLLPPKCLLDKQSKMVINSEIPSQFSVIADSSVVTVFVLTSHMLKYLSVPQRELFFTEIESRADPIHPFTDIQAKNYKEKVINWELFKQNLVEKKLQEEA
eukprot:TRINITY_DN4033_c0_g1_i3.p1 TRINITY_DN4033_c0_g1~~TRINITY_DN4033_c0_g1_i3.p1  ORF type:complete len:185 (+),score=23.34 TRINITY_DN4033_c0_g1_i3:158-712(+)